MMDWFHVTDKLPDKSGTYIVEQGDGRIATAVYDAFEQNWFIPNTIFRIGKDAFAAVIKWTPLPPAPNQSKGRIAIRTTLLPKDVNEYGNIFGGVILAHIDLAAAVEVRHHTKHRAVTGTMREVIFKKPVMVGDVVTFYTTVVAKSTKTITVKVAVESERRSGELIEVTTAEVVFVAIDDHGKSIALEA